MSPSFGRVSVKASHIGAPGLEVRVLFILVTAVRTNVGKVGHNAGMETRQTELDVPERVVTGDITELCVGGRRVFERPLIMVLRIHDVFVLFSVTLTAGGIFKMCSRAVVAAWSLDVFRTDVVTGNAVHIFMCTAS